MDEKLLNFFGSKECEFITCYGESMEPLIKDGSICVIDFKQDDGVILHSLNPLYKIYFIKVEIFCSLVW